MKPTTLTLVDNQAVCVDFKTGTLGKPYIEVIQYEACDAIETFSVYDLTKQDMENLIEWLKANLEKTLEKHYSGLANGEERPIGKINIPPECKDIKDWKFGEKPGIGVVNSNGNLFMVSEE